MTLILSLIAACVVFLLAMAVWTRRLTRQGLSTVPQMGQIVPVQGGSIHYVEKGDPDAQTLVLIHGLAGQLQHFTYALADQLAEEYHVIALDRPGCGYSTRETAELGQLPQQAAMIAEFLEIKGVDQAVLVGHSLGGAVSLALALDHPERVSGLALLAPLTHRLPETPVIFKPLDIRSGWLRSLIANTVAVPMAAKTAPYSLGVAFGPETAPDDFLDRAGGALGLRPSAFVTASQDVAGLDASCDAQVSRYPELSVPGGILYGRQDALLSPALHGPPMIKFGLSYEELDGLGHMILITEPEICAAFIRRMVAETKSPQTPLQEPTAAPVKEIPG
ncbi:MULTISPECIES: alpha/beta fold hydrolase [unclassified Ruegeria]|uniref:alpha/beta fold hydrolase n=1 Tax=unclassified Ruegeria TaxID=2625375 RepID=UPI001492F845|nr:MULTISPECIES: alpha/beta hydrolase [unclassified Ruegeria]NOD35399.1 alpha/beta fold hydrolase [Ruegeria sp. HKCCD7296]NOE42836.1 alpha/beta fold hydrolase [Ruegeria sp. HKCCD7319]